MISSTSVAASDYRLQFLSLDESPEEQCSVGDRSGARRLVGCVMRQKSINSIEIRVHNQWRPAPQVNIFFPPIRNVIG